MFDKSCIPLSIVLARPFAPYVMFDPRPFAPLVSLEPTSLTVS